MPVWLRLRAVRGDVRKRGFQNLQGLPPSPPTSLSRRGVGWPI
jgi:hypothetical protein